MARMIIKSFEVAKLKIALKKPFITALRRVDAIDDIVIKIHTNSKLVGYGEACAVTAITGTTNAHILDELHTLVFPLLKGKELSVKLLGTLHSMKLRPETKACVDIALYDLLAKLDNKPLFRYLGASKNQLQTDLTISVNTPEIMEKERLNEKYWLLNNYFFL